MNIQRNARWMRRFTHAAVLTSVVLPMAASTGMSATKPEIIVQPYSCVDTDSSFVSFQGVSLSVQEYDLSNHSKPNAGGLITITPAGKVNSLSFAVRGYTNVRITLTGNKGTAQAGVNNTSIHEFVPYTFTPPTHFEGNAGTNISTVKIRLENSVNFGSAPSYIQNIKVNGRYANVVLKSAGCIE